MGVSRRQARPGERPEDALIRELGEELGIEVKAACLAPLTFASHAYDDFHLLMPLYVCRRWEGFVQSREGQALKWVRPKELRYYPMPPADAPLIPHLVDLLGIAAACVIDQEIVIPRPTGRALWMTPGLAHRSAD